MTALPPSHSPAPADVDDLVEALAVALDNRGRESARAAAAVLRTRHADPLVVGIVGDVLDVLETYVVLTDIPV